jgi:glutaredoxin/glutathione-dependent peroxiredoxin
VPSYLENQAGLKSRGIDEVLCYCVNDGAVMDAWAKELKIQGSNLTFLGDPGLEFTTAIDLVKIYVMKLNWKKLCYVCILYQMY